MDGEFRRLHQLRAEILIGALIGLFAGALRLVWSRGAAGVDALNGPSTDAECAGLAASIAQTVEGVVVTDKEGIIQYVNPAFCRITGYTAEEAVGQNPRILRSGLQDPSFYDDLW